MQNKKNNALKWLCLVFFILVIIWGIILGIDYWRTMHHFEKPIFAMPRITADDGGSGTYSGIGYSFEIKGNFMPEDEFPGVTHGTFSLFGKNLKSVVRD